MNLSPGQSAALPWLFPAVLLLGVLAVAFAPNAVVGILGVLVFLILGFVVVPLYYRAHQQRRDQTEPGQ